LRCGLPPCTEPRVRTERRRAPLSQRQRDPRRTRAGSGPRWSLCRLSSFGPLSSTTKPASARRLSGFFCSSRLSKTTALRRDHLAPVTLPAGRAPPTGHSVMSMPARPTLEIARHSSRHAHQTTKSVTGNQTTQSSGKNHTEAGLA